MTLSQVSSPSDPRLPRAAPETTPGSRGEKPRARTRRWTRAALAGALLGLGFAPGAIATDLVELATRLVRAYHAGDLETLRPHLAPDLVFRDPGLDQRLDRAGFVGLVESMGDGESDRELEIAWAGATANTADVRGTWSASDAESDRRTELRFSIELDFDTGGETPLVVAWLDDFRRGRVWKPARGDGELVTEHFRLTYFASELPEDDATRLGETLERWYATTAEYLGRAFPEGYRLHINAADGHESPYASAPGPGAFMLVSSVSARREYGFSLVHELTHNLMGLSWLSQNVGEHEGEELTSGNRLLDEGFAVYVEEKLTGEGPRVWPNFGKETHAGYWNLRAEKGVPIWAPLDAELHRQRGDVRLAYLLQGSFCKYLVETHGLERFTRLFAAGPAAAEEIYGKSFAALGDEWRDHLQERFGEDAG